MSSESKQEVQKNQKRLILALIIALVFAVVMAVGLGVTYLTTQVSASSGGKRVASSGEPSVSPSSSLKPTQASKSAGQAPAGQAPAGQAPAQAPLPMAVCPSGNLAYAINGAVAGIIHGQLADFVVINAGWSLKNTSATNAIEIEANSSLFEVSLLGGGDDRVIQTANGRNANAISIPPNGSVGLVTEHSVYFMSNYDQATGLSGHIPSLKADWVGSDCSVSISVINAIFDKPALPPGN